MPRDLARRLCLLVLPLAVAGAALRVADARGPEWLGTNHDPTYTYLLSALAIAEGAPPGHIDHPGTPVQAGGALVLRLSHRLLGDGTLADDVLAHPEMYLRLLAGLLAGLYCAVLWTCGRVLLRVTGSLGTALAGQAAPLASVVVAMELPTFKPEPLLLSIGTALAALVALTLDGRRPGTGLLAAMGALAGLAVATKVTAAPLLALPLVIAVGRRQRAAALAAAAATFLGATAPAWSRVGAFLAFQRQVAAGPGMYGVAAFAPFTPYGPALRALVGQEWLVLAVAGAALAASLGRTGPLAHAERRALAAIGAALAAQCALVAVHPYHARYVAPVLGLVGLAAALLVRRAPPGAARAAAAALLLAAGAWELRALAKHVSVLARVARLQRAPDALVADYPQCPVVTYAVAATPAQALRHADEWLGGRYGRRLDALHAGARFVDARATFRSFGSEVPAAALARSPCLLLRGASGGLPQALPFAGRLTLLSDSTLEAVRLLTLRAPAPGAPFDGWTATRGLGAVEGPYPHRGIVQPVRWGLGRATRLAFAGGAGPGRLVLEATSFVPGQSIAVSLGGRLVARVDVRGDGAFSRSEVAFEAADGEAEVALDYARSVESDGRALAVLFGRLSLEGRGAAR